MRGLGGLLAAMLLLVGTAPLARAIPLSTEALLDSLQESAFRFFWNEANPANGLVKDRSTPGSPCSIASVGFGLSAICIGVDHGWVSRADAAERVVTALRTFWNGPQGSGATGFIGYRGLFYHFLDMQTATRTWDCEVSTIDSALLFAGMLHAKRYFDGGSPDEVEIRSLADAIYQRADWNFFRNFNQGILMGWKPGTGFSGFGQWIGYNEAMILYILALGSPTHAVPETAWTAWTSGYDWRTHYGQSYVEFPPLFGHQYSHCWVDFRYIQDAYMRNRGITYFENSRRATLAQRAYCIANPGGWVGYGENEWGITACDDPFGYSAHGAPPAQNDNGTLAPTAVAGSIPFAPEVVIPALHHLYDSYAETLWSIYGFKDAFNRTYDWWATDYIGIDEGPIILMIENYRNGGVWSLVSDDADIQRGLDRAGFTVATGVGEGAPLAQQPVLLQNAPNPFRGWTTIRFLLPRAGAVRLTIEDVAGRSLATLIEEWRGAGWNSATLRTSDLPAGVYFYTLAWDGRVARRSCVSVK